MASFIPFLRCSFGSSQGATDSDDERYFEDQPTPLESEIGRRESVALVEKLSETQAPYIVGREEAIVNISALQSSRYPSTPSNAAAAAPSSNLLNQFARVSSIAPPQHGLEWTNSRKLLEATIAFEQLDTSIDPMLHYRQDVEAQERRLVARLNALGLDMAVQRGDGNCQFRSLSYGLFGTPKYHKNTRKACVDHINRRRGEFEAFLGEDFKSYVRSMARDGEWGDELTLRAACETYGVVINVVTSDSENWFMRYLPEHTVVQREVFLSYIAPVHYNAIKKRASPVIRSMSSLGRKNSRIVAALDEYERTRTVPQQPTEVLFGSAS